MKKIFLFCATCLLLFSQCTPKTGGKVTDKTMDKPTMEKPGKDVADFRSKAPAPGPAPRIQMGSAEQFKLDNGLQVIVVENHKLPRVSYQLFVDAPSLYEGETAGAIGLAGQMLNKGTKQRKKSEIDESIDYIGGTLRTSASGMYGASLKRHNTTLLEVMSDVLLNPTFPQEEFDKLVKQSASSLSQEKDDPSALSGRISSLLVYGKDHPYGESMTEETLEKITLADTRKYYDTYFKPNISYLIIVGDITMAEAKPIVKKYFGNWKASSDNLTKLVGQSKAPNGTTVNFVNKSGAVQSVINVTYPVDLKPGSADVIPARVMNTILGAGVYFGNRLNQNLRETNAYTYGARSSLQSDKEVGVFSAGASVRNDVTDSSIIEIMNEFNSIRDVKVDEAELEKVKNVLSGAFGRSLESPETIARFALNTARYNLPADYYATYLERLDRVTVADVQAMAKKYIKPDNAHIVVVGNKDEVAASLAKFASDGQVNFYDYRGEKVEVMDMPIPEGVTAQTIVNDYLKALGKSDALDKLKSVEMKMTGNIQGMNVSVEMYQYVPGKYASFTSLNGNMMQAEILNGDKAVTSGMAGTKKLEGKELDDMKKKAIPFGERYYKQNGAELELVGIEKVEDALTYKIIVTEKDGTKTTDFYDIKSGLKVRTIITTDADGQQMTQTITVDDYKAVKGILFPHTLIISNSAMPMPMKMEAKSIKVNEDIDESVFNVE